MQRDIQGLSRRWCGEVWGTLMQADGSLNVIVVNDRALVGEAQCETLRWTATLAVEAELAADDEAAVRRLELAAADCLVVDMAEQSRPMDEVVASLRQAAPAAAIVLVVADDEEEGDGVRHALTLGVQDCVPRRELDESELRRVVRNAIVRKRRERELIFGALRDPLTGLANRTLFLDRLEMALASLRRPGGSGFAILFFDLDRFKQVNDTLGHGVGDELLMSVARRLEHCLRPGDTVARFGGDEFAILLAETEDVPAAVLVADRVQAMLGTSVRIRNHQLRTSASIGVALSTTGYTSAQDMLHDADLAMYRAKAGGKARYEVFDRLMLRSTQAQVRLEAELRRAIGSGDFIMHYQPIVTLATNRIVGVEGMVRWRHAELGLLEPVHFIHAAEESGLIVPLGWWVLRESCRQVKIWQQRFPAEPPLWVSVNVSERLLIQADMVERIGRMLEQVGLTPDSLRLEVTERAVLHHGDAAIVRLKELRQLGVRLSIDDFGTGYSSIGNLQRFRYDALKIDGSFIGGLDGEGPHDGLVETILTLADRLGIGVIAEGVETASQADRLRELQCPQGQGYWFARPLPPAAVEGLLGAPTLRASSVPN